MKKRQSLHKIVSLVLLLAGMGLMSACFHDEDSSPPPTYTIGGTVTGLTGTGLVLQNNGGDDLSISSDGSFTFGTAVTSGSYAVTVSTHPSDQDCVVTNSSGTVSGANITSVTVTCSVDATGYYTGSVTSDTATFDVQVLVNGTRLMVMSDPEVVLYDGEMTVVGNDFTATLTIYKNGEKTGTTSASGSIVKGSQINTTTLSGSGYGNGTLVATYDLTYNDEPASLDIIGSTTWATALNEDPADYFFTIDTAGNLIHDSNATVSTFRACEMNGTILPIGTSHLYEVNVTMSKCFNIDVNGDFTGLAATKDSGGSDDRLVFTISDGVYSTGDDFIRQ